MLVEPAKSVIADCHTISDLAITMEAVWRTLHSVYGYAAMNVPSQLAHISNKTAVELSETGL